MRKISYSAKLCGSVILLTVLNLPLANSQTNQRSRFQQELKKSTELIQKQRLERSQLSIQQAEKRALEIDAEGERRCKEIQEEEKVMVGDGRGLIFPLRQFRKASDEEIEVARKPYEEQVKSVHADTERRIREILDEGHNAATSVEQSAAHLHRGIREFSPPNADKVRSNLK
jgi:hypothetical protein